MVQAQEMLMPASWGTIIDRWLSFKGKPGTPSFRIHPWSLGFPGGSDGKESACSVGDLGSIPGLGRSPGGGHATYSSILAWRIPMDRGAWWATVHGVTVRYDWATKHQSPDLQAALRGFSSMLPDPWAALCPSPYHTVWLLSVLATLSLHCTVSSSAAGCGLSLCPAPSTGLDI